MQTFHVFKKSYVRSKKRSFSFPATKNMFTVPHTETWHKGKACNVCAEMPQQSLNKHSLYAKKTHFESY